LSISWPANGSSREADDAEVGSSVILAWRR
jgi:hypothetical protein